MLSYQPSLEHVEAFDVFRHDIMNTMQSLLQALRVNIYNTRLGQMVDEYPGSR